MRTTCGTLQETSALTGDLVVPVVLQTPDKPCSFAIFSDPDCHQTCRHLGLSKTLSIEGTPLCNLAAHVVD